MVKGGWERSKGGAAKLTAAMADVWLIEWRSDVRGHTYVNCSFVVAARAAVHQSLWIVLPGHRDPSHNQIKQPQSHMQDEQQLPRALPVLTYVSVINPCLLQQGPWLSARDLAFRDSVLMSDGLLVFVRCRFSLLTLVFFFQCSVAHKPHFPFEWLGLYTAAQYALCSIFSIMRQTMQPPSSIQQSCSVGSCSARSICVSLCAPDTNLRQTIFSGFCYLLVCSRFHQRPAVEWAVSFSLNLPSVEGQAPNTSDDFDAIQGRLVFFKLLICSVDKTNQRLIHKFFITNF